MSSRLRIDTKNGNYSRKFSNWLSQLLVLIMSKNLYLIAGRGSSKTTAFLVERVVEMMYDLPGAPVCWVSDTYTNLTTNILPNFIAGLEFSGFQEGIHFVVEKAPPEFTDAEKSALPDWLKPYFWKPKNKIISYTRKIVFFTGFNITFGSLDRPSSLAGNSYVHLIGDEAKYFKEAKIANLLKAVRGYKELYGDSVFYLGVTFTTDMPNTANIGEYDWILKQGKAMNVAGILRTVRAGFILNECTEELLAAKERGNPSDDAGFAYFLLCGKQLCECGCSYSGLH